MFVPPSLCDLSDWHITHSVRISENNLSNIINSNFDDGFVQTNGQSDPIILPYVVARQCQLESVNTNETYSDSERQLESVNTNETDSDSDTSDTEKVAAEKVAAAKAAVANVAAAKLAAAKAVVAKAVAEKAAAKAAAVKAAAEKDNAVKDLAEKAAAEKDAADKAASGKHNAVQNARKRRSQSISTDVINIPVKTNNGIQMAF